jgi:hypothetical protein
VAVVAVPKPAEAAPGPEAPEDVAIAAVPTPSPSLTPSPTPSPKPSQQPSPSPSATPTPAPSPVLQQPKPKPVVETPARSVPKSVPQSPGPSGKTDLSSPVDTASPPVTTTQEFPQTEPVKSGTELEAPKPGKKSTETPVGTNATFGQWTWSKDAEAAITDNIQLLKKPEREVPLLRSSLLQGSRLTVRVVGVFDRDKGTLISIKEDMKVEGLMLTDSQGGELRDVINGFLQQCEFKFEATDTVASPRVPLILVLDIQIL